MKLYYSPGACSLSPHIALQEAGLKFDSETVDLRTKKTKSGGDFTQVSPKGQVPALVLDDGQLLTEGAAMVQYIADRKPESKLAPAAGTMERYRLQEWLNFIASEVHKGFSPLFNPKTPDDMKQSAIDRLKLRFDYIAQQLAGKKYLLGDAFSVADGYLFTMLTWARGRKIETNDALNAYYDRVKVRPAVAATAQAEGITI